MPKKVRYSQPDLLNPNGHNRCDTHQKYALHCANFDALLERSKGVCEICRLPGFTNFYRKLFIDHDDRFGYWAVRGMLCSDCNMGLGRFKPTEAGRAYLAKPFYWELLEVWGAPDRMEEPPVGSMVTDFFGDVYLREDDNWWRQPIVPGSRPYWVRPQRRDPKLRDWRRLHYNNGPHILGHSLVLPGKATEVVAELRATLSAAELAEVTRLLATKLE